MSNKIIIPSGSEKSNIIVTPGDYKNKNIKQIIDKFLKGWLTPKQLVHMGPWYHDMLNSFYTEIALHIHSGFQPSFNDFSHAQVLHTRMKSYNNNKEEKPRRAHVTFEEISGGLQANVKLLPYDDV